MLLLIIPWSMSDDFQQTSAIYQRFCGRDRRGSSRARSAMPRLVEQAKILDKLLHDGDHNDQFYLLGAV